MNIYLLWQIPLTNMHSILPCTEIARVHEWTWNYRFDTIHYIEEVATSRIESDR